VRTDPEALIARHRQAFNERDFDVWRELFDEDVELLIDGVPFRGVEAAVGYGIASVSQLPGLFVGSQRITDLDYRGNLQLRGCWRVRVGWCTT